MIKIALFINKINIFISLRVKSPLGIFTLPISDNYYSIN
jgi:hypothetical protein